MLQINEAIDALQTLRSMPRIGTNQKNVTIEIENETAGDCITTAEKNEKNVNLKKYWFTFAIKYLTYNRKPTYVAQ